MLHVEYLISKVRVTESGGGNGSISIHNGHLLQRQLQSAVAANGTPPLPPQVSTSPDKVSCFQMDMGRNWLIFILLISIFGLISMTSNSFVLFWLAV